VSIGWQPTMETGAPLLDARHRALVEHAASLVATIEAGQDRQSVERAMLDFGDYAVRHFSTETDCSFGGQCPALEWSGRARADLIRVLASFRAAYEKSGTTPQLAEDLSCRLSDWVGTYIPGPDGLVRPCVTLAAR
jgi:hemerythrin-like metal-binding protein